jgi:hypothetical protein
VILPNEFIFAMAVIVLSAIGVCAIAVGWASARLLRIRWSGLIAAGDAVLALGVGIASIFAMAWLQMDSDTGPISIAGAGLFSVVLRHLARRVVGRDSIGSAA